MANRLFIDEIVSVGAVAEGDNPEAEIVFWKSKVTKSRQTVDTKGDRMVEFDFDGFTDEQRTAIESQFTVYEETIAGLTPPVEVDVTKDAPPEVLELITKQAAELEKALADNAAKDEEIAKEKKVRRDAEFIAKAADLEPVLGDPEEWGPVLDQLEDGASEAFGKLTERLIAAKAQIETGDLFKEFGGAGTGEQDRLELLTKAKMESNPELTVEQARVEIRRENPELYTEARSL